MHAVQRDAVQRRAAWIELSFSRGSRAKMPPISRRDARPLQRRVRRLAADDRSPPACAGHTCTGPHGTTSQAPVPHAAHDRIAHNRQRSEPRSARTHAWHNGLPAPRALEPHHRQRAASRTGARTTRRTTGTGTTQTGTTRIQVALSNSQQKACRSHSLAAERVAHQPPRARHAIGEIARISRAKRSAGCACWAASW